jgi:hypothetical protein
MKENETNKNKTRILRIRKQIVVKYGERCWGIDFEVGTWF